MYLAYYNLSTKPFKISPDPRFLWLGSDHKEALANFKYGLLESNGYVVLIGAVGTGKTTLVNALLQMLDTNVLVANINYPSLDAVDFLSLVVRTYDPSAVVSSKADCLHFLKGFLRRARSAGKTVLLVIDEAHRLSEALLEEIRLLSNMEHDGENLVNIFFVGQTELKRTLQSSHCRALRQRITLFYHLQPLSETDTLQYIAHRLNKAGAETQLFTPQAMHAVYKFSRGYPRLINKLCDRALLTGFVKEQKTISAAIILECAREISLIDPIMPAVPMANRLPHPARNWSDMGRWRGARANMRENIAAALKHVRRAGAAAAASSRPAIQVGPQSVRNTIARFLRKLPAKVMLATSAVAVLIIAAWMFAAIIRKPGQTEPHATADLAQTVQETNRPADDSASAPKVPPSAGEQPSPLPDRPATPEASPAPAATDAPVPPVPSVREMAAALLGKHDFASVIALLEADGDPAPQNTADLRTLYAQALVGRAGQLAAQSPAEAETLLRKAVAADASNVEALVQLGNLRTRAKAYAEAIGSYQKAVQLNPRRADVLFNLGFIFASTGMYASAEEMLARVVQLKPEYIDKALFNLAVVQHKIGKRQESLASLEAAVAIRPENVQAQAYLKELKAAEEEVR